MPCQAGANCGERNSITGRTCVVRRALRFDGLAGFRYLSLNENLNIVEQGNVINSSPDFPYLTAGTTLYGADSFNTQNQFYGGQVGFICEYRLNRWVVNLRTTLALGDTNQNLQIWGKEVITSNGTSVPFRGDLLTQRPPMNIGAYSRNQLSFVPEVGINLGYQVTDNLKLFVGYNFLFWTNVIRPADQIDPCGKHRECPTAP